MNENEPTDSKATPTESNEPTAPAEVVKAHDFKGDARKAATGVKRLWNDLRRHDYKAEIRETFASAKKNPSSLWKKPETPRPGKDLAVAGLAVAVAGLFLLLVTSGVFVGAVSLLLGLAALFAGVLGLKTEGRSLAFAGAGVGVLAVLLSIGQIHSATRKPDPRDELIRLLTAQQSRESDRSVSRKDVAELLTRLEEAKSGKSKQSPEELADAVSKLDSLTSTLKGEAAEAVASGLGRLLADGSDPDGGKAAQEVASGVGRLFIGGSDTDAVGAAGAVVSGLGKLFGGDSGPAGGGESIEDARARVATDPSLTVQPLPDSQNPSKVARPFVKVDNPAWGQGAGSQAGRTKVGKKTDAPPEPPAGPSGKRIDEVLPILEKAKIETMVVALPNDVRLLLCKLPDGSFMGTFEVTQDQWLSVMGGENPSAEENQGDDHPVDSIWPADALAFVEKLNALPAAREAGLQFRIPSEEEWETACLAGAKKDFGKRLDGVRVDPYNLAKDVPEIAWFSGNRVIPNDGRAHADMSHAVGRKQPNAFGLYDMHGNVEEMTLGKNPVTGRFQAKGGHSGSTYDMCRADRSKSVNEPSPHAKGQEPAPLMGFRVAASALDKNIARILAAAEKVVADGGAAFFGFYPGMPEEDATKLANHYGLSVDDPFTRGDGYEERNAPGRCQLVTNPATREVVQVRFDMQSVQALTKESFKSQELGPFCAMLSNHVGNLECIRDGKNTNAPNIPPKNYLYQRKIPDGTVVSFEEATIKTRKNNSGPYMTRTAVILTLEDPAEMASLAAAQMAAANNARIEEVEPVLAKAGIKTKTIEFPGGVKLLLTLLPNERYLGTFEVTQAQYFSLMGTNVSQCVGADLPVDSVSLRDCLDFIAKANELPAVKEEELRFRLPSHAEWETARRSKTEDDDTKRLDGTEDDKNSISVMTNPSDAGKTTQHGPHSVGVSMPNAYGLYKLGDVSEWKSDDPANRKSASSLGFRVSVVSWPREIQRAKDEAAKAYALSNNGRIDAVKPVLEKAGIETKEVELPGGVKLLMNKTPAGAWAAAFEVTQAQWKSLLHDNPSSFQGDPLCTDDIVLEIWRSWGDKNPEKLRGTGLPVDQVSPGDVQLFLVLLNALPSVGEAGIAFHLPTEDEWLYIASAGAKSKYAKPLGGGDSSVHLMGWHKDNVGSDKRAPKHLQIVGQKQPNAFGLYDVHGNVAEFAESRFGGRSKPGIYSKGGSIGGSSSIHSGQEDCALDKEIAGYGDKEGWQAAFGAAKAPVAPFNGFRLVATETSRHFVDPEMAAANNARIDAVKPALDARGIETKILDLPGGVKLLLNKLPGGLWAGAFEVTQAQFLSLLGENPSVVIDFLSKEVYDRPWQYRTGDRPVDTVTKAGADAFLSALNALPSAKASGLSFGLPDCKTWVKFCGAELHELTAGKMTNSSGVPISEAEFEASKNLRGWDRNFSGISLPAGKELKNIGWFHKDGAESSHPVGEKEPNRFGLYDIFGNVSEWTGTRDEVVEARRKREGPLGGDTVVNGKVVADSQFYVTGGSHHRLYNNYPFYSQYSSALGNLAATGFRVWAAPAKAASAAPEDPGPNPFAQASNDRIDTVKPVLTEAGIETKEIELPGGVRILMNKLPNGAWMAAFETTQAQFASVFGRNPSRKVSRGGDRAVENVSWNAATVYASVLNRLPSVKESGLHFRLPSSTEWEYACRGGGGLAPQGKPLEKGKGKLDDMGWYDKNSDIEGVGQTHRVGQLQPNAFGLYDMIGNVGEWTSTAYSQRAAGDHTVGSRRIWRGGTWISPKERCTAAWRGLLPSDAARPDTGFRLFATEDGSDPKDETVVFRDKEYKDAIEPGPLPDDRTAEQKLIGALLDLQTEMQKAEIRLQVEEARFELELMGIDPDTLF